MWYVLLSDTLSNLMFYMQNHEHDVCVSAMISEGLEDTKTEDF